jgi:hypothetical protein
VENRTCLDPQQDQFGHELNLGKLLEIQQKQAFLLPAFRADQAIAFKAIRLCGNWGSGYSGGNFES